MSSEQEMRAVAARIQALVHDFAGSADPAIRSKAQELVRLVMTLYGAGLARILQLLALEDVHAGRAADHTAAALRADDLVASLLVLHDLHPEDVETRIARGLERVGPLIGGTITLVGIRDGAARVKVEALSQPNTALLVDLHRLIESVVHAVAPDVLRVDVEGLPRSAPPAPLIQLARNPVSDRTSPMSAQ
jgi:hypothetical protein